MNHTRRDLLRCLALGGMVVAGELWIPGAKKIFISSSKVFEEPKILAATMTMSENNGVWTGEWKILAVEKGQSGTEV